MEGNIIMDRDLKRSIILDNYQNPNMKHTSNEDYVKINTRNVSCIDNLDIYLKIENDTFYTPYSDDQIFTHYKPFEELQTHIENYTYNNIDSLCELWLSNNN